jgi:penicillin amidase
MRDVSDVRISEPADEPAAGGPAEAGAQPVAAGAIAEPVAVGTAAESVATEAGAESVASASPTAPGRSRGWRRARKVVMWTLAVVLALTLVGTGLVVWSVRRAFPQHGGEIRLAGLSAPVTVYRDDKGIPQVYATTATDLFKAQGYLHAQDRFWEMDFRRHVTSGRLSELFGKDQVSTDAFLRTLGWRRVAEKEWNSVISDQARGYLQAYADGVNAWIADNGGSAASGAKSLEYSVLGLSNSGYTIEKWDPIDSLAWLKAMAWDLRGNMEEEIARAVLLAHGLSRDQVNQLYPSYPYERNRPIIDGGTVVDGTFNPAATPAGIPRDGGNGAPITALREAAPSLSALSNAVSLLPHLVGDGGPGIGSNSWVISGALTATGKPLLANDPHLSPSMPGIWYQIGLHCGCEFNVEGFSFSGVPGVVIGHNARIAWGFTNLGPDVTDLYLEKLNGDTVFDGSTWQPIDKRDEVITVAGGSPVTITVRSTKHGPLLSDRSQQILTMAARPAVDPSGSPVSRASAAPTPSLDRGSAGVPAAAAASPYGVALRWTALDPGRTVEALFGLDSAANWSELRAAASLFDVPAQNIVYADVDGNIGYQSPGRVPIRGKGDGTWPAPGWDPTYDWQGYIPFAEMPSELNPADGWIVTANQSVVGPRYPHLLTYDWAYGYRSQRIMEMMRERIAAGKITAETVRAMQFDNRNGFAPTLVPALLAAPLDPAAPHAAEISTARDLLRTWDFQQPADSPAASSAAAAFYNATWRHLLLRTFDELPDDQKPNGQDRWFEVMRTLLAQPTSPWWDDTSTARTETRDDILAAAMADAVSELNDRAGSTPADWRWGKLHTLALVNQTFGKSGIGPIEWLFNRGPAPVSGGSSIVNATSWTASDGYDTDEVPSMRMIVDLSNFDNSRWVQLTGNSGHAFHPNYSDQFDLWRTGQNLPMPWDRPTIEKSATHTLTLHP